MTRRKSQLFLKGLSSTLLALFGMVPPAHAVEGVRTISLAELENKIRGGWAGQAIGVAYGEPTEFRFLGRTIGREITWDAASVVNAINQDDLYTEMIFCAVMDKVGIDASMQEFGEAFGRYPGAFWHANLAARRNILRALVLGEVLARARQGHAVCL